MKDKISLSMSNLLVVIVFLLCGYMALEPVSDNDTWWHIKTGEYIVKNLSIPTTDIFSFYGMENNLHWTAHEWLSDVVLYLFYHIGGFPLLMALPIILLFITLFIMYRLMKPIFYHNFLIGTIWFFILGFTLSLFTTTRPHMFSLILFALTVSIVYSFIKRKSRVIYTLPIITLLWANLHGGSSSLPLVLLIIVLVSSFIPVKWERVKPFLLTRYQKKTLFIVLLLSTLSICINPYGWKMLIYPIVNMMDKTMLALIVEWQSPNLHNVTGVVIFVVVGIAVSMVLLSKKSISILDFLLLGAFAYLTFKSLRQVTYFAIVVTPIVMYHLPVFIRQNTKNLLNGVIIFVFAILFLANGVQKMLTPTDTETYPSKEMIEKIEEVKPERLFNNYDWGGYLIFHLHDKEIYPFIDGRADIFSKHTMEDYHTLYSLTPNWREKIKEYQFDAVLFQKNLSLPAELVNTGEWKVYYKDDISVLLVKKKDSEN